MFIDAKFIKIEKIMPKNRNYPQIDRWLNKTWYIHAMEYGLAVKRNEVLTPATAWLKMLY